MYMYNWLILLYTWNQDNTVECYTPIKKKNKKKKRIKGPEEEVGRFAYFGNSYRCISVSIGLFFSLYLAK